MVVYFFWQIRSHSKVSPKKVIDALDAVPYAAAVGLTAVFRIMASDVKLRLEIS